MMIKNLLIKSIFVSLLSGAMIFGMESEYEISNYDSTRDSEDVLSMKALRNKQLKIPAESFFSGLFFQFLLRYPIFFRMMRVDGLQVLRKSGTVAAFINYYTDKKGKVIVSMEVAYPEEEKTKVK